MTSLLNPYRFTAAAFVPTDIAGCALWLDASDAASITHAANVISQWNDKSGNTNHAAQATENRKPIYGTDATTGKGKVTFDGANTSAGDFMSIPDHATLDLTTGMTFFLALDLASLPAYGCLFSKDDTTWATAYACIANSAGTSLSARANGTSALMASASLTGRHVVIGRKSGTHLDGYWDSATYTTHTSMAGNITANAKPLYVAGGDGAGLYGCGGAYFEKILYNNDIGDANITTVFDYLKAKWSTT